MYTASSLVVSAWGFRVRVTAWLPTYWVQDGGPSSFGSDELKAHIPQGVPAAECGALVKCPV